MKQLFLAILSGALLGVSFVLPQLWPLALIGIVPLLLAITVPSISRKRAFVLGMLTGFVLHGIGLWATFWGVLPLDWLGIFDPSLQRAFVAIEWTMTSFGFALWTGVFALIYSRAWNNSWRDILTASSLWVVTETLGAWWFGIQNIGPGSIIGPHFTITFVGNVLAVDTALVQAAWVGGVYALSAIVIAIGATAYRFVRGGVKERRIIGIVAFIILTIWISGHVALSYIPNEASGQSIKIAAITTQEPASFSTTPQQDSARSELIQGLLQKTLGADIVVLPESSDFLTLLREPSPAKAQLILRNIYKETTLPVFIDSGSAYSSQGTLRSRVEVYDVSENASEFQDKRFLLPDGEYLSTYFRALIKSLNRDSDLEEFLDQFSYTPGDDIRPLAANSTSVGVLFCNEVLSPVLYRSLARQGSGVFVNVASHGWFHGSHFVANQLRNLAIIRAVESRRWYVQASNFAPSFAIDPYGRIATSSDRGATGVIVVSVETRSDTTPYTYFGSWLVWFSVAVLLVIFARSRKAVR